MTRVIGSFQASISIVPKRLTDIVLKMRVTSAHLKAVWRAAITFTTSRITNCRINSGTCSKDTKPDHPDNDFDWISYNQIVSEGHTAIAARELAACAYTPRPLPADPEGFEFRFCLPGKGGYAGYRNLETGELRFFRRTPTGFVELNNLQRGA